MKKRLNSSVKSGFTLVEMLMTLALLGLAAAAGYSALRTSLLRLDRIIDASNQTSDEIVALTVIAHDLREVYLSSGDHATFFIGRHDDSDLPRLEFTRSTEEGAVEVDFFLLKNKEGRSDMVRRTGPTEEILYKNVDVFELHYLDENVSRNTWGWDDERRRPFQGIRGLPLAALVRINRTTIVAPIMTSVLNKHL